MVVLQVFPEPQCQRGGQAREGLVVHAGLPLPQVVHQHIADGPAGQVIAVDQLLDGQLPGEAGAEHPDSGRRAGGEDAGRVQKLVEERAMPVGPAAAGEHLAAVLQQLQAVSGGDIADASALGRHDQRDPLDRGQEGGVSHDAGRAHRLQPGNPFGIADPGHLLGCPHR